jgi:peroxiredoxin
MNSFFLANPTPAPDWTVSQWLNTNSPLSLADLRGKVVVIHAFQMLCPGCVLHGTPQATRLFQHFDRTDVSVIGLHTVFENHDAMTPRALEVFLHEFRVEFPVGVDTPGDGDPIPQTMRRYQLRGTPSLLLIDRSGHLRAHRFGAVEDLAAGSAIQHLIDEPLTNQTNS